MLKGTELMQDIELEMDILEPTDGMELDPRVTDLKLKYAILQILEDINTNLYEISRYGIGTD